MISRFERFSFAMFEITRYWHKISSDEMTRFGLKGQHSVYLMTLYNHPEGITAARLSELCSKDKADVSRMMSIMEDRGLVKKEAVNGSNYRARLSLTRLGMEAAEHVEQRARLAVDLAGGWMSDETRSEFYHALEKIASNLQQISEGGLPEV